MTGDEYSAILELNAWNRGRMNEFTDLQEPL